MAFFQEPPQLANQYDDDALLREWLERALPREVLSEVTEELRHLGQLGSEMFLESLRDRENEPKIVQWDAWGHRIDRIQITPLWEKSQVISAEHGLVAAAYEKK